MTMAPLEKAARALPQMLGPHAFDDLPADRAEQRESLRRFGYNYEHTQADMLALVRAVLEAIREPSEGMVEAAEALWWLDFSSDEEVELTVTAEQARQIHRAMIDAALSE
jgi:hypothetical protein